MPTRSRNSPSRLPCCSYPFPPSPPPRPSAPATPPPPIHRAASDTTPARCNSLAIRIHIYAPESFTTPRPPIVRSWAAVILQANFSITAGIQYDRTANIWIGPTNVYFGTTAEDQPGEAATGALSATSQTTVPSLPFPGRHRRSFNIVNSTYTGILYGSAKCSSTRWRRISNRQHRDQVIAFSGGPPAAPSPSIPRPACSNRL